MRREGQQTYGNNPSLSLSLTFSPCFHPGVSCHSGSASLATGRLTMAAAALPIVALFCKITYTAGYLPAYEYVYIRSSIEIRCHTDRVETITDGEYTRRLAVQCEVFTCHQAGSSAAIPFREARTRAFAPPRDTKTPRRRVTGQPHPWNSPTSCLAKRLLPVDEHPIWHNSVATTEYHRPSQPAAKRRLVTQLVLPA
ncbi:hypothetical protein BaRGS_00014005 [Batillaria attramentaria]|uniref:Uncharacterized protein n=1 Tax=Batillaria attramentaria TaxID=370345 RepID=A0ABD0L6C9_9CAEN